MRRAQRAVEALRAFSESPPMIGLRTALGVSFVGLILGVIAFVVAGKGTLVERLAGAVIPALGGMAIVLAAALGAQLAARTGLPRLLMTATSVGAFMCTLPRRHGATPLEFFRALGGAGLFLALICAFAVWLCAQLFARRFRLRPDVAAICGSVVALAVFASIGAAGISIGDLVSMSLQPLGALGDSYLGLVTIVAIEAALWTIGIHGPALLAAIVTPVYLTLQAENTHAFVQGHALPHLVVVSTFLFVFPGGAGATLPLVLLLLLSPVARARTIARASSIPALFNINEPLIFGLPLVLEPAFTIPFIGVPIVLATTTYVAMKLHAVAAPAYYVPGSVPGIVSSYLATMDWRGPVLYGFNLALATLLWLPFVRLYERTRVAA